MSRIILSTLNARYIHCAFGLRYLKVNMQSLEPDTSIIEFTIHERPIDIAEKLLQHKPTIIGLGVYIWNIEETTKLVALLKSISPDTIIILGGPEVSYETEQQTIHNNADYVITGQGDKAFPQLCFDILNTNTPKQKIISAQPPRLSDITLPYRLYSDEDIAHRIIYVEASRGCPFKCEFCLSALDKTAWQFDIDLFLSEMDSLYQRGARHFKFVDRTFNLKIDVSIKILEFFLARMNDQLFLHFELIPDHLPDRLKEMIKQFPSGCLQFEIGIQSLNPNTQALISRKQDNLKTITNLKWIKTQTNAHIHADLIIGLPGEDMNSFAEGFNQLVEIEPHEIQVGILKRLRGSTITRHTQQFKMCFSPNPPYDILSNTDIDFVTMRRLNRFARYWDMIANSGRFQHTLPLLLGHNAFYNFITLSDWLFEHTDQTHRIALARLYQLVFKGANECLDLVAAELSDSLTQDFNQSGLKGYPRFENNTPKTSIKSTSSTASRRQIRHLNNI